MVEVRDDGRGIAEGGDAARDAINRGMEEGGVIIEGVDRGDAGVVDLEAAAETTLLSFARGDRPNENDSSSPSS